MQWAAPGTQLNAQSHNTEDFGSVLDTAGQRTWDVPDVLPCSDETILLHRVKNTRCSSLHQPAARLEDFLKILLPWKAFSIFLGSCLEKHLSAPKTWPSLWIPAHQKKVGQWSDNIWHMFFAYAFNYNLIFSLAKPYSDSQFLLPKSFQVLKHCLVLLLIFTTVRC